MLKIVKASERQLFEIMKIYESARDFMRSNGNSNQWINGYPQPEVIEKDISNGNLYLVMSDNVIAGVFCFIIGKDPSYKTIQGNWLNNDKYGTIHRLASAGNIKGVANASLGYCLKRINNIRLDTHSDNHVMQRWILKNGFQYCGIIHVDDGSPRLAYQLSTHNS